MEEVTEEVLFGGESDDQSWTLDVADERPEVRRWTPKRTMPSAGDSNWIGGDDCSKWHRVTDHLIRQLLWPSAGRRMLTMNLSIAAVAAADDTIAAVVDGNRLDDGDVDEREDGEVAGSNDENNWPMSDSGTDHSRQSLILLCQSARL